MQSPYKITSIKPNKHTTAASVRLKHSKRSIAQQSDPDYNMSLQQTTMDKSAQMTTEPQNLKKLTVNMSRNQRNAQTTLNNEVGISRHSLEAQQFLVNESATIDHSTEQQNLAYRKGSLNL